MNVPSARRHRGGLLPPVSPPTHPILFRAHSIASMAFVFSYNELPYVVRLHSSLSAPFAFFGSLSCQLVPLMRPLCPHFAKGLCRNSLILLIPADLPPPSFLRYRLFFFLGPLPSTDPSRKDNVTADPTLHFPLR